jgi:hypothetical protein
LEISDRVQKLSKESKRVTSLIDYSIVIEMSSTTSLVDSSDSYSLAVDTRDPYHNDS